MIFIWKHIPIFSRQCSSESPTSGKYFGSFVEKIKMYVCHGRYETTLL